MYICIPSESGTRSSFVSLPLFHARLHGQLQLIFHAQGEDKASDLASNGQGHEDGDLASHAEGGDQASLKNVVQINPGCKMNLSNV